MNITMFKKLAEVKDPALLDFALHQLLDHNDEPVTLKSLSSDAIQQYTDLILDLMEIKREDFERLIEFASTEDIILERDLETYLDEIYSEDLTLPTEVFKPLINSQYFNDVLTVYTDTGEVIVSSTEEIIDDFTITLFNQLEQIIDYRLNEMA